MTDLAANASIVTSSPLSQCGDGDGHLDGRPLLATSPHVSNRYHFGMLLGVDDLETEQAYHRGKHWLHQAWLHRAGVIWGYEVADHNDGEVRVGPGLAIDCRGRELCLEQGMCLDLGAWYDTHREDLAVEGDPNANPIFEAHVTVRFRACLDRQVPALRDACGDPNATTAYSRVVETVDLDLVGGPSPAAADAPYPRLRSMFGLGESPEDWSASGTFDEIIQAALVADSMGLVDEKDIVANERIIGERPVFPCGSDDTDIVLASLRVELQRQGERWDLVAVEIDNEVRSVVVDTSTLQALALGTSEPDAGAGAQLVAGSLVVAATAATFATTVPLRAETLTDQSLSIAGFDDSGWTILDLDGPPEVVDETTITVNVDPAGPELTDFELVRLVATGTGPTPVLDENLSPLVGATDQPSNPNAGGQDAVLEHRS